MASMKTNKQGKKKKLLIKILAVLVGVGLVVGTGFGIYVSDYYHVADYELSPEEQAVTVSRYDNVTVYGDITSAEKGFIFYPGGKVEAAAYEPILYRLAQKDICCFLVEMPCNLAVFGMNEAADVMEEFPEIEDWYIGGHSLGGAMAASFAADHQDQVKGLVLLAAYSTKKLGEGVAVLSIYGSEDQVLNREKYAENRGLAENLTELVIEGGNHGGFGNYGQQEGDGRATVAQDKQWDVTAEKIAEWIMTQADGQESTESKS